MKEKLYYIGERDNPQLSKNYYVSYGQLSKAKAKKREECVYGSMTLTGYKTEKEYLNTIEKLQEKGFSVRLCPV